MAFEFLLIALIDGQQPITLNRYNDDTYCLSAAMELSRFARKNYPDENTRAEKTKRALIYELAQFNEKWTASKIEMPSDEEIDGISSQWAESIYADALEAETKGLEIDMPELSSDAMLVKILAKTFVENKNEPNAQKDELNQYFIDPDRVDYFCLATPK